MIPNGDDTIEKVCNYGKSQLGMRSSKYIAYYSRYLMIIDVIEIGLEQAPFVVFCY